MAESEATRLLEAELRSVVADRDRLWHALGDTQAERDTLREERDRLQAKFDAMPDVYQRCLTAEARVEALEEALREIAATRWAVDSREASWMRTVANRALAAARPDGEPRQDA